MYLYNRLSDTFTMKSTQVYAIAIAVLVTLQFVSAHPIFSNKPGDDVELIPSLQTFLRLVGIGKMTDPWFDRMKQRWDNLFVQ